jgi:pre-mRNA-processing factor 39
VRLNYARFEESIGNPESAIDILEDVLRVMPGNVETTLAIVNTHRRSSGVDTAIEVLSRHISETTDVHVRSALIVEKTRLVWRVKGDAVRARAIFQDHHSQALDSRKFWIGWFDFEAAQPTSEADEASNFERIKHVYELSRRVAQLPAEVGQELSSMYFQYLEERGGKNAMEEFIELDRVVNGPVGANRQAENNILPDGKSATQHAVAGVNGTSGGAKAAESGIPRTANPVSVPIGGYGMNGS